MPIRPQTFPPRPWLLIPSRPFSTTQSKPAVNRGGGSRSLPDFNWRKPYKNFPRPSVSLISDESAANDYLASLTSKRLTIEAETGYSVRPGVNLTRETKHSEGVMTLADAEGVIILHLAQMKRAPEVLLSILADPTVEKQNFGANYILKCIAVRDPEFFSNCQPTNFLDLRPLAANLHPRLARLDNGMVHKNFMIEYARDGLGVDFRRATTSRAEYSVQRIAPDAIDAIVNETWLTHIAGHYLRSRLEVKIGQALEKDIPNIMKQNRGMPEPDDGDKKILTQMLVTKSLDSYRYNAKDVAEARQAWSSS
ncbi:uncharacterized protein JCM6883_004659 [Sporobolomyces salmoneus]|uniref:uncharacterized protein n=1 Tax=Sporobolomyces salmoneus TaxID=183962 RepID=UPI00317978A7